MRKLIFIIFLLIQAMSANAAIALLRNVKCTGATCTTAAADMRGANLFVACNKSFTTEATFSDSSSNVWYKALTRNQSSDILTMYYVVNPITSSAQTFTQGVNSFGLYVAAFSGVNISTQVGNITVNSNASATTLAPGVINPDLANELFVTCSQSRTGLSVAVDSNFIVLQRDVFSGGAVYGGGIAMYLNPSADSINPTWSNFNATISIVAMISFRAGTMRAISAVGKFR